MKKNYVIINEQHTLSEQQKEVLFDNFPDYEIYDVPAKGWNIGQMNEVIKFMRDNAESVIFVSPIPYLIKQLSCLHFQHYKLEVLIFHNDNRVKKELPNGKIIFTVAESGWILV